MDWCPYYGCQYVRYFFQFSLYFDLFVVLFRDTVGTFEIAEAFAKYKMITCIHKHYSTEEWASWAAAHPDVLKFMAVSSGTSEEDFKKVGAILQVADVPFICLDVANGYSEHVK